MRLFGKRRAVEPEAVFLSGFESEDHYLTRSVDWESEATDVDAALVMARDWIVTGDRQVEIIKLAAEQAEWLPSCLLGESSGSRLS